MHRESRIAHLNSPSLEQLKSLVLSVIQGEQDYQALLNLLEPVTLGGKGLESDTALALALLGLLGWSLRQLRREERDA